MDITTTAEAAALARLTEIRRVLAEDRAAFADLMARHPGRITASSVRPADPPPAEPRPVNHHPGPDFAPEAAA